MVTVYINDGFKLAIFIEPAVPITSPITDTGLTENVPLDTNR